MTDDTVESRIVNLEVDSAYSVAADADGVCDAVYFDTAQHDDGKFYFSALVDCDTSNYVGDLVTDEGPYDTEHEALLAGLHVALEWFHDNDHPDYEVDSRIDDAEAA